MDKSKSVLSIMKPFGYISKNKKAFLSYFIDYENTKRISSIAFSYYNTSLYRELILLLCFSTVERNIKSLRPMNIKSLYKGAPLIYTGKSIHHKGSIFTYEGINEKTGDIIVRPLKITKVTGDMHEYPKENFEKIFSLIEIDIDEFSKKKKFIDVRDRFAYLFGIEKINRVTDERIVILASKRLIDEIVETVYKLNDQTFRLKDVCNFNYLKSTGELVSYSSTSIVEKPMVIFSSHIFSLIDYIEDVYDKSSDLIVNVIEDKWIKKAQISNLYSLKNVCKEEDVTLRVVASMSSVLNDEALNLFTELSGINIWENCEIFKDTKPVIKVKLVACNKEFSEALDFFSNYLELIKEESHLLFFDKLLKKYLKLIFSQIDNNSSVIGEFMSKVSEYGERIQAPNLNEVHQAIYNIFDNRFGNKMKSTLERMIDTDGKTALVVMDEMTYEVKEYYSKNRNITIYSLTSEITEDIYDEYSKIIIISPYVNERRRWMYSGLETPMYFLIPEVQTKYLEKSLKKDLKSFSKITEMNGFETNFIIKNYEEVIKQILDSIAVSNQDQQNSFTNRMEGIEEDDNSSTELSQKRFEHILETVEDSEFLDTSSSQNIFVTVNYGIDLLSGDHVLGTSKGKIFILDSQEKCRKIPISQLKVNHKIIDFIIPYSDEFYRRNLKLLLDNNLLYHEVETSEYLDVYWKMRLINYVKENELTTKQIQEEIESKGYRKRSEKFYISWTEIDKLRIKPHDVSFIKYIGDVVGDVDLSVNPEKYYYASKNVKRNLYELREKTLDSFNGKSLAEVLKLKIIDSYSIEEIINIERIEIEEVRRTMTNKVLRRRAELDS